MKLFAAGLLVALLTMPSALARSRRASFVEVRNSRLEIKGVPYRFVGTNFWYGMNLGADDATGNRPRLTRELDRLKKLGVTNLRVVAGAEGPDSEPWRIVPSLQTAPGQYNVHVARGFDFLLKEMGKRDMRAVVCLNNFWPWSGGFAQYLAWTGAGSIPYPPPAAGGDWNTYQLYTGRFYSNPAAVQLVNDFIAHVVKKYAANPTIMAWELANEPRGYGNTADFNVWLGKTASLIKSLDRNHLVTTGSEGDTPNPAVAGNDFLANHSSPDIDYATIHIWAQNWGWYDPKRNAETYDAAVAKMKDYLAAHVAKARQLGKPLVVEEFGLGRDEGSYDPATTTAVRDRYYAAVFQEVYAAAASGAPVAGVNFWAWGGEGRPSSPGGIWHRGDSFVGDPPHELQGWYGVYASDTSTTKIISDYAAKMSRLR